MKNTLTVAACLILIWSQWTWACTTIFVSRAPGKVMANNFDFYVGHGRIFINKAHMKKHSLAVKPGDIPTTWTSSYASLTLNLVGQEFPNGGINEKGLAIEIMTLAEAAYPSPDSRPSLNEVQWIQYMLDTATTVDDVVRESAVLRVSDVAEPVHYLVCDLHDTCATFEYLKGQLVVHQNLAVNTLTNDTYDHSVAYLKQFKGFGGTEPTPTEINSLNRFVMAATGVSNIDLSEPNLVTAAFAVIDSVKSPGSSPTQWQVVYDMTAMNVFFRVSTDGATKNIQFSNFSSSCKDPVYSLSMDDARSGDVTKNLVPITVKDNYAFVANTVNALQNIPNEIKPKLIPLIAGYPQTTSCSE